MNIGFDAKRAFHNGTGLGHYSRTLIHSLNEYYPQHEYFLFNPKSSSLFNMEGKHLHEVRPAGFLPRLFPSAWRSGWVVKDLKRLKIGLYHGLSHEIPFGIQRSGIRSVVTIHDLIHERFPEQYSAIDRNVYTRKYKNACKHADRVIAISEQTRKDLMEIYHVPEEKIVVCYQSCNPAFAERVSDDQKKAVREKYGLPARFFLYVGSIIERKNLLNCCKAIFLLRNTLDIPLVVIGNGGKYKQLVTDYIRQNRLENKIIFLSDNPVARSSESFQTAKDFPAIYQSALAMLYPSFFEGFGIPVLEALWSKLPVITSNLSSLPEAGGKGAYYVDPNSTQEIAEAMRKLSSDKILPGILTEAGWKHAQLFTPANCAANVMKVYESVW
jgi:glycosyltransferase involved in cell wall biosynthesis